MPTGFKRRGHGGNEDQPKADYKFKGFAEAAGAPSGPRGRTHFLSDEGNLGFALLRLTKTKLNGS